MRIDVFIYIKYALKWSKKNILATFYEKPWGKLKETILVLFNSPKQEYNSLQT